MYFSSLVLAASAVYCQSVTIKAPAATPSSSVPAVNPGFLGLGIESWTFPEFTGTQQQPNTFSLNMFKALSSRVGALPIRLGGDSADRVLYVPTQTQSILYGTSTIMPTNRFAPSESGPSYLEKLSLIDNVKWTYQIPLLRNNLSNAVIYADAVLAAIPTGSFDAFEIGNEPAQYGKLAPKEYGTWSPTAYDKAWKAWTAQLTSSVKSLPNGPNFWALSLANGASGEWGLQNAFNDGLQTATGIKAISQHYYQANLQNGNSAYTQSLLNHTATVNRLSNFKSDISFLNNKNLPFIMGEVGAGVCGSCNNIINISFGAGIWAIDFLLAAMSIGVARVNMQYIGGEQLAGWNPVPNTIGGKQYPTSVFGTFYGELFIADLFAKTKGTLKVVNMGLVAGHPYLPSYAAYDGGVLSKIIILNENVYLSSSNAPRPSADVTLTGLSASSVLVEYLTGAATDQYTTISWAGQQWSSTTGLPVDVKNDTVTYPVSAQGEVTIPLEASQVVMVTLNN